MLLPMVLLQSLRRKHFLVFFTTATAIVLRAQIALSSSILQSVLVQRHRPVDVEILDFFTDNADDLDFDDMDSGLDQYAYVNALQEFDMDLPFGVSPECAYQTFIQLDAEGMPSQLEPSESLTVTVDGLYAETSCLLLEDYNVSVLAEPQLPNADLLLELRFEHCDQVVKVPPSGDQSPGRYHEMSWADRNNSRPCPSPSLPQHNPQFVYIITDFAESPKDPSRSQVANCIAALCSSVGWISKVNIVDDGISRTVLPLVNPGANTTFDMDIWKLMSSSSVLMEALSNFRDSDGFSGFRLGMGRKKKMMMMKRLTSSNDLPPPQQASELYKFVQDMTRNFTPIFLHGELRKTTQKRVLGTKLRPVARLQANLGICLSMAVMSAICAAWTLLATRETQKVLRHYSRDPTTMLGSIIHICGRPVE